MSDNPVDPQLKPTLTVKQVGNKVYAINGLPRRSQELIFPAEQISVDDSGFITISGDDVQDVFNDIDIHLTSISGQLVENVVFTYSNQTVSGEKTFVDDLRVASSLLPSGSTVDIGASGVEFQAAYIQTVHADEILIEGSPGLKLGHDGVRGFVDSSQDNDIELRRNGVPFLRLEEGLANFNQDVAILGNFSVSGTTTTLNTEQLLVEDNLVTLNSTHSGTPVLDAGIEINRGSQPNALLTWDEFNDYWEAGISGSLQKVILLSDLLSASGTLQTDINTRVTTAQLLSASGTLQTDINTRVTTAQLLSASGTLQADINTRVTTAQLLSASGTLQTDINTRATVVQLVAASGVLQTDINTRVLKAGDTMTGNLSLDTADILNTTSGANDLGSLALPFAEVHTRLAFGYTTPSTSFHLTNKSYVDTQDALKLNLAGGTLTGDVLATTTGVDLGSASLEFGNVYAVAFRGPTDAIIVAETDDVLLRASDSIQFQNEAGSTTYWAINDTGTTGALVPGDNAYNIGTSSSSSHVGTVFTAGISSAANNAGVGLAIDSTFDLNLTSNSDINIYTDDADSGDNGAVFVGIGPSPNYARGGFLYITGNENAGDGDVRLGAGETGNVQLFAGSVGGQNALRWQIGTTGQLTNENTDTNAAKIVVNASDGAFTSSIQQLTADRGASTAFEFLRTIADADGTPDGKHVLRGDGQSFADGAWNSSGADYAEYFELKEGEELPSLGSTVVLDIDRVRAYNPETDSPQDIIGVVRADGSSSTVGNHPINWPNRYVKSVFGEYLLDEEGNRIQNPDFDPEQEYVYRSAREEWILVGLLGQVPILKTAAKNPSWKKMKDLNESVEFWLIK